MDMVPRELQKLTNMSLQALEEYSELQMVTSVTYIWLDSKSARSKEGEIYGWVKERYHMETLSNNQVPP